MSEKTEDRTMILKGQKRVDAKLKAFKRERRERMLERCRETADVTVEERDGKIIEWRGQRCIGGRAYGCFR